MHDIHICVGGKRQCLKQVDATRAGEDFFHIFADVDTSIEDQKLIYVRYPLRIKWHPDNLPEENTDCELPDEVHNEVVERAVSLMKNDIPSRTNPPVVPVQPQ